MIDKVGGRKALMLVITLASGIGCVALKGDIPANFLMLLQTIFGGFIVGNGMEHLSNARRAAPKEVPVEAVSAPVSPEPEDEGYDGVSEVEDLESHSEHLANDTIVDISEKLDTTMEQIGLMSDSISTHSAALDYLVNYVQAQEKAVQAAHAEAIRNKVRSS